MFPGIYFLQPVLPLKVFPHFQMMLRVRIHQWSNPQMRPEPSRSNPCLLLNATTLRHLSSGRTLQFQTTLRTSELTKSQISHLRTKDPSWFPNIVKGNDCSTGQWELIHSMRGTYSSKHSMLPEASILFEVTKHTLKAESNHGHISKCWFCGSANTLWLSSFPTETFPTITWWRRVDS